MLKNKVVVINRAGGAVSSAVARAFSRSTASPFLDGRHQAPNDAVAKRLSNISCFIPVASAIVAGCTMFASLELHGMPATQLILREMSAPVEMQRSWRLPTSELLTREGSRDTISPSRGLEILAPAGDGWG